jgi:hypothetical protein
MLVAPGGVLNTDTNRSGNTVSHQQMPSVLSSFSDCEVVAVGGSVCLFVAADVELSNVNDENSFSSIQAKQNSADKRDRFKLTAYAGSIAISSRLSITLSNVNVKSCSATARYDGSSRLSLAAIAGAILLSSSVNPFSILERNIFVKGSRFSLNGVSIHNNKATCIHSVVEDSALDSILTVLGGGVTLLHADNFEPCLNVTNCTTNMDNTISLTSVVFSNNSISASFPTPPLAFTARSVAKSVVLGGALYAPPPLPPPPPRTLFPHAVAGLYTRCPAWTRARALCCSAS